MKTSASQLDEMCMGLNELAREGAAIEVTFYDTEFDEEEKRPAPKPATTS
jgi:hypothetical protein